MCSCTVGSMLPRAASATQPSFVGFLLEQSNRVASRWHWMLATWSARIGGPCSPRTHEARAAPREWDDCPEAAAGRRGRRTRAPTGPSSPAAELTVLLPTSRSRERAAASFTGDYPCLEGMGTVAFTHGASRSTVITAVPHGPEEALTIT